MKQPDDPTDVCQDEEYEMPSVDALMAGTLALMTGYAQAAPDGPQRPLMGKKLVSHLFFLAQHPQVSPPLRAMLGNLRTRWQLSLEANADPTPTSTVPWMPAHGTLQ